ncbi:MAG: DUF177 domain-containing protein [Acidimicrobiales bacterium]
MAGHRFLVHAAKLRRAIGERWHEERHGPMEDLTCVGSTVPEGADVTVDVVLESVLGGVSVVGAVRAPWAGECRRCLTPATGVLQVPVRELYTEDGDGEETYPLVGDELDLELLARDAVLLELPVAPLCRADCLGLCPQCGANRNEEACACEPPSDPRWGPLDALRVPATGAEGGNVGAEGEDAGRR